MNALPSWNLNDLYPAPDAPSFLADIATAERLCKAFQAQYEASLLTASGATLAKAIAEYEAIQEIIGRISSYASLKYAENMSDAGVAQFYQNTTEKVNELSLYTLFFTLAINKWEEVELQAKLKESSALQRYAPWLRDVRALKPYQLSDELEKLLHEKYVSGRAAWTRLFDETEAALRFEVDGKTLTSAEVFHLLSGKDGALRQKAAKEIGRVFKENIRIFALITNTLAKDKDIEDSWRGFAAPISSRNVSNQVEDGVVNALLSTVEANYARLSHRYYAFKAKAFGQSSLAYWDRNAPYPEDEDRHYAWPEAQELVLFAYRAFSPKLAEVGQVFFDKQWIDVPPRPGKSPGAFAHPTVPSAHPYLLLNYQGKARDVMTLAHELGHGVHQVLSAKQGALMCDTPLTLAETASVFGEQLAFRAVLKREEDPAKRRYLLASKIEDMLNTVVRQVAFCLFETRVHAERKQGELTAERLGEIWLDVQQKSLGPAIRFDEEYAYYWSYIPHFIHSPFYVYAYAFGDCLVNSLYAVYEQEAAAGRAQAFEQKYLAMLEAGGTLRHKELLAPFGLDASDPHFWQQGLDIIARFIDELEAA